jgi:uncharacterized protein
MKETSQKLTALQDRLRSLGGVMVAYSAGVDSTFLAAVAHDVLGDRAVAVTGISDSLATREREDAVALARQIGIRHETVMTNEIAVEGYLANAGDRCYFCKQELFTLLKRMADERGISAVADGTNADDVGDVRPGRRAAGELGIISPLLEAGIGKEEIRAWSRERGLPTADKPEMACLASRVPEGTRISPDMLHAIDRVEGALKGIGFRQVRVRHHGGIARIELDEAEIPGMLAGETRARVSGIVKAAGFRYATIDLDGYRRKRPAPAGDSPTDQ